MKRLSDEFVGLMRDLDWKLDYSEESVQTLEEMIEQQFGDCRPWRRGKVAAKNLPVASLVGAYLGEVMIRHFGGHWGGCRTLTWPRCNFRPAPGPHHLRRLRSGS
jgi:hypothetical protein